jgi:acetolactate synthase I/II/III large subunit
VKKAIEDSMKITDRPTLLDFHVAKEENVLPFVPPGQALNEMLVD